MNKIARGIGAGAILLILLCIWPLQIFKTADINYSNRLLKDESSYTFDYLSQGNNLSVIWTGKGQKVDKAAIRLRFQGEVTANTTFHCCVYDSVGNVVADPYIQTLPRTEGDVYEFQIGKVLEEGQPYQFTITLDQGPDVGVFCMEGTENPAVILFESGEQCVISGALSNFAIAENICLWALGLFMAGILLFAKTEGESTVVKKLLPSGMAFLFLLIYGQYLTDHNMEAASAMHTGIFLMICFVVLAALESFCAQHRFLIMGTMLLAVGSVYLVSMPLGMVPDEANHFYRAFALSFGNLFSQVFDVQTAQIGAVLPVSIKNFGDLSAVFDFSDTTQVSFNNTSLYSPVCYLPQMFGIRIALLFTQNVHAVFLAARWAGFLTAFLLGMLTLYLMPYGREVLFLIMLLPMSLQEMTGVTSDCMTNALAFLFTAYVLHCLAKGESVSRRSAVCLTALASCIGLCKIVYVVLILLLLLLPVETQQKGKTVLVRGWMLGIPAVLCLLSNSLFGQNLVSYGDQMNAAEQVKFVLTHVPDTIMTVVRSTLEYGGQWIMETTGDYLGELDIRTLPLITIVLVLLLLAAALRTPVPSYMQSKQTRRLLGGICLLVFLLTLGSIYVTWNIVGDYMIRGIQGRYFLTVLPVFLLWIGLWSRQETKAAFHKEQVITGDLLLMLMNMLVISDVYRYLITQQLL